MAAKPDKITIEPGKYATVVRLHYGAESDLWRKGPYKRERAFASAQTAIEHARRAFPGVPIEMKANGRRSRRNTGDIYAEWDRVNDEQRRAERSGDYKAIERAKAETRRVYNEMKMQLRRNRSTNRHRLSFEEWAEAAGLDPSRPGRGAHIAWVRGDDPRIWRSLASTVARNPAGSLDAAEFCALVKSMVDLHGKYMSCSHGGMGSHSQVFVDFVNLPVERVREKRGGGAEASNNRFLAVVDGFARQLGEPPPAGKVKAKTRISLYGAPPALSKFRAKTGTPEAVAKYVAAHISKMTAEVPSQFTHANRRRTSRKKKRTSRRSR